MNTQGSNDFLDLSEEELAVIGGIAAAASNIWYLFDPDELNDKYQSFVNKLMEVRDQLTTILQTLFLFKVLTNFSAEEFEELCGLVCPMISSHT